MLTMCDLNKTELRKNSKYRKKNERSSPSGTYVGVVKSDNACAALLATDFARHDRACTCADGVAKRGLETRSYTGLLGLVQPIDLLSARN